MTFAVNPLSLYSSARVSTKLSCADFAAVYNAIFAEGFTVSGIETTITRPHWLAAMCGDKCLKQMKRRPHVLIEHGFKIVRVGFGNGLAACPAADEMDQGVDAAKFGKNSFG